MAYASTGHGRTARRARRVVTAMTAGIILAACSAGTPVDALFGSGGEEFRHGASPLVVPPVGSALVPPNRGDAELVAPPSPAPTTAVIASALPATPVATAAPALVEPAATAVLAPAATAVLAPSGTAGLWIQAGVFAQAGNADRAEAALSPIGSVALAPVTLGGVSATRVRVGPFASLVAAQQALAAVRAAGYADAHIVRP